MDGASENLGARAQRSAADLSDRIDRIWTGKTHLDGLEDPGTIDEVRRRKTELADDIDEEWANLVLLALWDSRRGEKDEIRAHAKNALCFLAAKNTYGSSRSLDDLARLVSLCLMEHEYRSEEIGDNWRSDEPGGYVVIDISGAGLPTAVDVRALFDGFEKNLQSMCRVVSLGVDPACLFSAEQFPPPVQDPRERPWKADLAGAASSSVGSNAAVNARLARGGRDRHDSGRVLVSAGSRRRRIHRLPEGGG